MRPFSVKLLSSFTTLTRPGHEPVRVASRSQRLFVLKGNEASPPFKGEIAPGPLKERHIAIAKPDQEEEMHERPGEPGWKASEPNEPEICNSIGAPDRGQRPLVAIVEGPLVLLACHASSNDRSGILTLLDGHLCDAWKRFAVLGQGGGISKHKDVR